MNADPENVEKLRQGCCGMYEEKSPLEFYAVYTVVGAYMERLIGEELIGLMLVLSSYKKL